MSDETIAMSPLDEPDSVEMPLAPGAGFEPVEPNDPDEELEAVDGLPVLAEARPLAPTTYLALPAVQAAAVAATGFVAGAATVALVRRHSARKLARSRTAPRRAIDMLPIVGSRTFLVDVHLLGKPGE